MMKATSLPAPGSAAPARAVVRPRAAAVPPDALFQPFMPGIAHRTSGEILVHPGYAQLRHHYIATTIPDYEIARFPGTLQSAAYRVASIGAIICLHAAHDEADRATWPTLRRLKDAMAVLGLSSPRQIDDFVARLAETGHVVPDRSASDGRVRLLRPSDKLLAWDREIQRTYYGNLQLLYPEPGYGPALAGEPAFHLAQRRTAVAILPVIRRFLADNVDLIDFHAMYQGAPILMILADEHARDPDGAVRESSFNDFRIRFGISRSHVRNVLFTAEERGLVERSGTPRRTFELTARGLAAIDRFIANTLASHDLTYRLAMRDLGRSVDGC